MLQPRIMGQACADAHFMLLVKSNSHDSKDRATVFTDGPNHPIIKTSGSKNMAIRTDCVCVNVACWVDAIQKSASSIVRGILV